MPLWGKTLILKQICIGIEKVRNGLTHQASFATIICIITKLYFFRLATNYYQYRLLSNKTYLKLPVAGAVLCL